VAKPIRRIVTGHNEAGKSVVLMDGAAPHPYDTSGGKSHSVVVTELWETRENPADNSGRAETTDHPFRIYPPKDGSVFRIIEYPPDRERPPAVDTVARFAAMGAPEAPDRNHPRHASFHKTNTIDYVLVVSGEIYALLDDGEVLLKTGDTMIQRGTNHGWSNRSDAPCLVAFVMLHSKPVA
jgi:hypothetical protein